MTIVSQITVVFKALADWFVQILPSVTSIFYDAESGLTFLGTLSVIGLGISVFFLLMGIIQNFLHLRG